MKRQKIVILGSTGSIGTSTLDVVRKFRDTFEVHALAAGRNIQRLAEQAREFAVKTVVISHAEDLPLAQSLLPEKTQILVGVPGMCTVAKDPDVDVVLCAVVGTAGLLPVMDAARAGKRIALASKEVLVMAGEIVQKEVKASGAVLLPVDSEHSAIFQCLQGGERRDVSRLILTASGGPFRTLPKAEMAAIRPESAARHPTWKMGKKITIDSASLMNKALELIEAVHLFQIPESQIDVVVHPQSLVHSMVEFADATLLAQMSVPDMRSPIQYALTYPRKLPGLLKPLDFKTLISMTFEPVDDDRFPAIQMARRALQIRGAAPAVLNAANEIAVERFVRGEVCFTDIFAIVNDALNHYEPPPNPTLDSILEADALAREHARNWMAHG